MGHVGIPLLPYPPLLPYRPPPALEADLPADLENPRIQNLRRRQPGSAVAGIHRPDRARVQDVVRIEIPLHAKPSEPEDLSNAYVQPRDPILEHRLRFDDRDGHRGGARRKRTPKR